MNLKDHKNDPASSPPVKGGDEADASSRKPSGLRGSSSFEKRSLLGNNQNLYASVFGPSLISIVCFNRFQFTVAG